MLSYYQHALNQFFHKSLTTLMLFAVVAIFLPASVVYGYFKTPDAMMLFLTMLVIVGTALCMLCNALNVVPRRIYYFIVYSLVIYCWIATASDMLESVLTIFTVHGVNEFLVLPLYNWRNIKNGKPIKGID